MLVDNSAAVDLGRNEVINQDYLLTCGWGFGHSFTVIHASANLVCVIMVLHSFIPAVHVQPFIIS